MTMSPLEFAFDLIVSRAIHDDEVDALFEAGCDDCAPEIGSDRTVLHFDRAAPALVEAIASAVLDVESTGLAVDGVGANDLVDLPEIAARVGRTRESVRLLANGRRGPGGFPPSDGGFYSWAAVRSWFAEYDPAAVGAPTGEELDFDRLVAAADHVVRARRLARGVAHAEGLGALFSA